MIRVLYKPVRDFPNYRVGNDGSVWSKACGTWKRLATSTNGKGYVTVNLWRNNKGYTRYLHRLALASFVGPCPAGMEARHRNGVRSDNRRRNLKWGTPKQNASDKLKHGTAGREHFKINPIQGARHHKAKLTDEDVLTIRADHASNAATNAELARRYRVTSANISDIVHGKTWKHLLA